MMAWECHEPAARGMDRLHGAPEEDAFLLREGHHVPSCPEDSGHLLGLLQIQLASVSFICNPHPAK